MSEFVLLIFMILSPPIGGESGIDLESLRRLEIKGLFKGRISFFQYAKIRYHYSYLLNFRNNFKYRYLNLISKELEPRFFTISKEKYYESFAERKDVPIYTDSRYSITVAERFRAAKSEIKRELKNYVANTPNSFNPLKEKRVELLKRNLHKRFYEIHKEVAKELNQMDVVDKIEHAEIMQTGYFKREEVKE
ncbi:MAG: hypothetical protein ABDH49_06715 [Candidatus Hydrothermales bacterium]